MTKYIRPPHGPGFFHCSPSENCASDQWNKLDDNYKSRYTLCDATPRARRANQSRFNFHEARVGVYYTCRVFSQKSGCEWARECRFVSRSAANKRLYNKFAPSNARCSPGRKLNYMHYRSWYNCVMLERETCVYRDDIHHIVCWLGLYCLRVHVFAPAARGDECARSRSPYLCYTFNAFSRHKPDLVAAADQRCKFLTQTKNWIWLRDYKQSISLVIVGKYINIMSGEYQNLRAFNQTEAFTRKLSNQFARGFVILVEIKLFYTLRVPLQSRECNTQKAHLYFYPNKIKVVVAEIS